MTDAELITTETDQLPQVEPHTDDSIEDEIFPEDNLNTLNVKTGKSNSTSFDSVEIDENLPGNVY